jgi:hypothetical protein
MREKKLLLVFPRDLSSIFFLVPALLLRSLTTAVADQTRAEDLAARRAKCDRISSPGAFLFQ